VCWPGSALQASRYNIGGYDYVLDDLENGILRGNSPAASTIGMLLKLPWLSKGPFKAGDPRAQHVSSHCCLIVATAGTSHAHNLGPIIRTLARGHLTLW
jgi:hypothetical protein